MTEIKQSIAGFNIVKTQELKDCHGTMTIMEHAKTGAKLCYLHRDDDNMTFSIAFKTIPQDDTGVFHILEHSVLNGSDKYPVKEPFVELLKSSMNTFLNAMTFSDKTMFPVSSRNHKDFMNLVSIYLDAVFHPSIYHNRHIFEQEGWHYELRHPEDELVYKGVVLNEMKGATSSIDDCIVDKTCTVLYKDNCYRFNSGGSPDHITDLSYEQFLETHRTFYHPSNAYIFLDGEIDLDAVLPLIDACLSAYDKKTLSFSIPEETILPASSHEFPYEIQDGESEEDKTIFAFAKIMMSYADREKNIAFNVLTSLLTSSNDSPLKKALLDKGLCEDVEFVLMDGIQQPFAILLIRNTEKDKLDEIKAVIDETIQNLLTNGLDEEEITATLNQMEFRYRERSEPAGIINAEEVMESWLYCDDPSMYLSLSTVYEALHEKNGSGYYEKLLEEFFLDKEHIQTILFTPSNTLGKTRALEEKKRLADIKASWNKETIEEMIRENEALDTWQKEPDSEEALATLPKLAISDVEVLPRKDNRNTKEYRHVPLLIYPAEDSGIVYMNHYFNLAGIPENMLSSLSFYVSLLTDLPTKNYSVKELQKEIKKTIGSLSFSVSAVSKVNDIEKTTPLLVVRCAVLKENCDKAQQLIHEILTTTIFTKEAILPLLKQTVIAYQQALTDNGHAFAGVRTLSHLTAEGAFKEFTSGYEKYLWLNHFNAHFEEDIDLFINDCALYTENLFIASRLTSSITGEENEGIIETFIDSLPYGEANRAMVHYPLLHGDKEIIEIPGSIGYVALAAKAGEYDSSMSVMSHLLTYDWMWSEVRVKGGSYGARASIGTNGIFSAYSYRDPSIPHSLSAIRSIPDYLSKTDEELAIDQYIIGAVAASTPLLSPSSKIAVADTRYFSNITYEDRAHNRRRMVETTIDDLHTYAHMLARALQQPVICAAVPSSYLDSLKEEEMTILKTE